MRVKSNVSSSRLPLVIGLGLALTIAAPVGAQTLTYVPGETTFPLPGNVTLPAGFDPAATWCAFPVDSSGSPVPPMFMAGYNYATARPTCCPGPTAPVATLASVNICLPEVGNNKTACTWTFNECPGLGNTGTATVDLLLAIEYPLPGNMSQMSYQSGTINGAQTQSLFQTTYGVQVQASSSGTIGSFSATSSEVGGRVWGNGTSWQNQDGKGFGAVTGIDPLDHSQDIFWFVPNVTDLISEISPYSATEGWNLNYGVPTQVTMGQLAGTVALPTTGNDLAFVAALTPAQRVGFLKMDPFYNGAFGAGQYDAATNTPYVGPNTYNCTRHVGKPLTCQHQPLLAPAPAPDPSRFMPLSEYSGPNAIKLIGPACEPPQCGSYTNPYTVNSQQLTQDYTGWLSQTNETFLLGADFKIFGYGVTLQAGITAQQQYQRQFVTSVGTFTQTTFNLATSSFPGSQVDQAFNVYMDSLFGTYLFVPVAQALVPPLPNSINSYWTGPLTNFNALAYGYGTYVIDAIGDPTQGMANVQLVPSSTDTVAATGTDQAWTLLANGYIQNVRTGECLDVDGQVIVNGQRTLGDMKPGANVHLSGCEWGGFDGSGVPTDQRWRRVNAVNGSGYSFYLMNEQPAAADGSALCLGLSQMPSWVWGTTGSLANVQLKLQVCEFTGTLNVPASSDSWGYNMPTAQIWTL